MPRMATDEAGTRRWTRIEYEKLIDLGIFRPDEAVELIGGELIVSEPQGALHYTAILKTARALEVAFGAGWVVRTQSPSGSTTTPSPNPTWPWSAAASMTIAPHIRPGRPSRSRWPSRASTPTAGARAVPTRGARPSARPWRCALWRCRAPPSAWPICSRERPPHRDRSIARPDCAARRGMRDRGTAALDRRQRVQIDQAVLDQRPGSPRVVLRDRADPLQGGGSHAAGRGYPCGSARRAESTPHDLPAPLGLEQQVARRDRPDGRDRTTPRP